MAGGFTSRQSEAEYKEFTEKAREALGEGKRYVYIKTFGCQQNEADSERLLGMALDMGYEEAASPEEADLILVNTCAVREHAELKTLSITGQYKHIKEKRPSLKIGICGCMVSQRHREEDIKNKYPYVDFLFGTSQLPRFPEILYNSLISDKRRFYSNGEGETPPPAEGLPVKRQNGSRAWVSIMYGCDNFCSYCVVPYVRGRERSRAKEAVLGEIKELAASGYREITLLGQNVNSYRPDISSDYGFADLLEDICKIEGNFIIRFMTSHPKDVTRRLIEVIAAQPKMAKHFHLPLQSGSDNILQAMNRGYTSKKYLESIDYMRSLMPDIGLSTDIIVGFPGETEDDFSDTIKMLETVRFDSIFSFIYSKRKGTPAADYKEQVPERTKKERFARLLETQNRISYEKNQSYLGKTVMALVECQSKTDPDRLTARTEKGRLIHFPGPPSLIGQTLPIKITRAETYALYGDYGGTETRGYAIFFKRK